jgi:hypothetical protein
VAFAKLRKATVSFVVCLSSAWNNSARLYGFSGNLIFEGFRKPVLKTQVCLSLTRIASILHEGLCIFMIIFRRLILRMRNVSGQIVIRIKTYFMLDNFFLGSRAVYEVMWKNYGRPGQATDNIIRRMRLVYCISKATHTQTHTRAHTHTHTHAPHTRTHTHAPHVRTTRARTHAHTHTHTNRMSDTSCFSRQ